MEKTWLFRIGVAVLSLMPTMVYAQSAPEEDVSVADRPRPEFDPIGDRVGIFTLFPAITATGVATSNYLASDIDRHGDVYLLLTPEVTARTDDGRNRTQTRAFVTQSVHATLPEDDTSDYGLSSTGSFDVTRQTQLRADASYQHDTEDRSSLGAFQETEEPVTYDVLHGGLGASHVFNNLTLGADGALDYRNYNDTHFRDGQPIDQDYRDVRDLSISGSAQYALHNGIGLLVSGSYSDENYPHRQVFADGTTLDRNSSGFNIEGGVSLALTHLIFGHVQIGYLSRHYPDPLLEDVGGLSYSADVLWNVTPLTSLRLVGSRSVEDTSSTLIAGNTVSDVHFYVDHELYRYIIVSGDVGYDRFTPNGIGIGGSEYTGGIHVRYLINRRYTLSGSLRYSGRSSDSQYLRYSAVSGTIALRVAF